MLQTVRATTGPGQLMIFHPQLFGQQVGHNLGMFLPGIGGLETPRELLGKCERHLHELQDAA